MKRVLLGEHITKLGNVLEYRHGKSLSRFMRYSASAGYTQSVRIVLEAEAVLGILSLGDAGLIELVSSEALVYEAEQNPLPTRQEHSYSVLAKAKTTINVTTGVREGVPALVAWRQAARRASSGFSRGKQS